MAITLGIIKAALVIGFQDIKTKPKRGFGPFSPQLVVEEIHDDELEITEQPVENGAAISDHAFKRPATVTLRYGWSNSPSATSFIGGLIGAVTGTIDGVQSVLSGSEPNQIKEIYQRLLELQAGLPGEGPKPFTAYTGKRTYYNMLVKSLRVTTDRETENVLMVDVVLKQVIIANTQTVALVVPASEQKDPGSTATPTNSGTKQLGPAPNYNDAGAGRGFVNPPMVTP